MPYAAEHAIGHKPRNSYEKQAIIYPEKLRAEYMKASQTINIFSNISNYIKVDHQKADLLKENKKISQRLDNLEEEQESTKRKDFIKLFKSIPKEQLREIVKEIS